MCMLIGGRMAGDRMIGREETVGSTIKVIRYF